MRPSGVAVSVTLAYFADSSTPSADVKRLRMGGAAARYSLTPYMHAKLILVQGQRAFVGSQNFSAVSLDANRKVGMIVADTEVIGRLASVAQSDWSASQAA